MLALNQTFDETRSVKVLVVPIGNNSLFNDHFQVVSNLRDVPFYELNRPPAASNANSAFKHFNWNDGNLLFDFLRYDRVLIGPGDLSNFQSSKRVLMIMGLINYPELGATADSIEEELEYFARRHPNILLRRIFVFNYSFDDPQAHSNVAPLYTRIRDPASLVIFPPDGTCGSNSNSNNEGFEGIEYEDAINNASHSMVDVHLQEVMSHAALHIVLALETQVKLCEEHRVKNVLPEGLPMSTLFDDLDSEASPREGLATNTLSTTSGGVLSSYGNSNKSLVSRKAAANMYKKKPSGRIHKWMGDLCMQACTPRDAYEHYATSISECKALGEQLWLAGALDGFASSVILLLHMHANVEEICNKEFKNMLTTSYSNSGIGAVGVNTFVDNSSNSTTESVVEKAYRLVEDRMNDAISIYSSSIVYCALEVECILRVASMFETSTVHPNKELKVLEYVLRAVAVPGFNAQQQIEVTLEGGLRCHRMGLWRKYALFLYIAALQSADNESYGVAHALIRYACSEYGIQTTSTTTTTGDQLSPLQATSVPHSGNIGCVRLGHHSLSTSTSTSNGNLNITNDVHGTGGDSSTAAPASAVTSNSYSTDGVWSGLRTSLFSTAALIADEHGDPLAATQYLVSLMQLIQEGEHTHCLTRRHWLNMSSHQLFEESGNNLNTTTHGYSNNNNNNGYSTATGIAATNTSKVRWENDLSAPGTNAPNTPTPSANDISPVPRRSKSTADSDYNYNNNNNNTNNNNNNYTEDYTPPPAGNRPTSYSLSQQVNKNNISPMVSRRLDTGNSTDDFADNNNNNNNNINSGNSEKQRNMRRLAVPALSERLNSLSHLTHAAASAPRPKNINTMQNTYNVTTNPNKPGEFLIDRFLRTLSTQADSGMSVNYANYANAAALNSALANNNANNSGMSNSTSEMYSAAIAADTLEAMAQLVSSSRYSVEVQEEIHGLFARLSKSIVPSTALPLPLSMYHVRPVVLTGRAKPIVVQCSALTAARRNWQLYKDKVTLSGTDNALVSTGIATTAESSSLFYDPFAAKRQKAHNLAQQHALLYSVHSPCILVVTFSNPLSIPVLLNAVFPVLTGVEHTVYPISVQIPPNAEQYTIELVFLCKSLGTVVVQGVQFVINNATHLLRVDKEGNYSDPTRSGPVPKRIGNSSTTATSETNTTTATVATNTILTVPATIPLILTTSCSAQAPPLSPNTDPVGTIVDTSITTTSTAQRRVSTTSSSSKSTQNVVIPDEVAHVTLYPGETRVETVQLHTTHSMNKPSNMEDAVNTADSTQETHIRFTLHQYTEHTTHNTKSNSNTITHKTTSNVVLDYTGPLQSPDIVNTSTSNTTNTASAPTNAINACSLQSYLHQVSPLPESHTNTPNNVSSLLTQLTLAFHHNTTANTTVKYVDIEIEVCNAPATVFTSINLLKQDNSACGSAVDAIEDALNLTLYSRIHRLRVYIHSVPGLTATTIAPLHTSTRLSLPPYQLNNVEASLQALLLQNKVNPAVSHNKPGDNSACNNPVRLLPNEMGVVLEVRNKSEWWMLVALSKAQIEYSVRTMYQLGTVYTNNTTTTSPFNGSSGAIENATVVSPSDIANLPGALLLLPPKSARSVVIQYPTHCYSTNSARTATSYGIAVSKGVGAGASLESMSLLWAAVDLSRSSTSMSVNHGDSAEGDLSRVLRNLRYGEVLLGANSNVSVHKTTSVSSSTAITTTTNTDTMAHSSPVNLHSDSTLIARLLGSVPQITICTQLYGNENAAAALVPHIKDAHLGDLYSIRACQFYDVSVTVSRCDWHNVSFEGDVRVELSVVVIQNEVPALSLDDEKNKASGGSIDMGTKMRPCVMTGKPYCSYVLSGGQNENTNRVSAEGNSGSSVVHKLRLCFAYGGSYNVLPLVRVTSLCGSTAHHASASSTSLVENNTSIGTGVEKSGNVGGSSWWTATGSYVRVVAK